MRSLILRRFVTAIVLLMGLLAQVQAVYACDLMDTSPSTICCCDAEMGDGCAMGGGCVPPAATSSPGCCDITLEAPASLTAAPVTQTHAVTWLSAPQPPPAILPSSLSIYPSADPGASKDFDSQPLWYSGTDIYLVTLRLRN